MMEVDLSGLDQMCPSCTRRIGDHSRPDAAKCGYQLMVDLAKKKIKVIQTG